MGANRWSAALLAASLTAAGAIPAVAWAQGPLLDDAELARVSSVIVTGTVTGLSTARDNDSGYIYTYVTIAVHEAVKGRVFEPEIVIKQLGGAVGDLEMVVYDQAEFTVNEQVLLFLALRPSDRTLQTAGLWQGKWTISRDPVADGDLAVRSALRARDHAGLAGSNPGDDVRLLRPFVSELRSWAPGEERGRLARQRPFKVRPAETPAPSTMQSTASLAVSEAGFTLLGSGSRWREADDGDPVQVDVQHGGEAGLAGGGLAEIDRARSWWNNAGGTLELASGNRHRAQGYSASQVCNDTGVVDGRMSLYFGDPCDEIANDGTLAIGGFYSSGSLQNVNGTGFRRIVKGYVINSDEAGVQSWLGTSRCFEDVQAHELGHAIGIGHTSVAGNIMRPTINSGCLSQAPGSVTSPTGLLGADDIAALRYIYPADDASGASKPPQPTGTQASLTTPTVTWADNADNETRYKVYRKVGSNHYEKVAILPANSTSYYDTDMVPGEVHCYRVRAQNDLGYSPYSPIACVGFEVPERPAWVSAVATGPSRVEVTWADSSSNEDRFKVYRRVNGGSWEKVARIWAGTTFFADTTVSPGNRYCYRVRAQNALGYSRYSPWSCITP